MAKVNSITPGQRFGRWTAISKSPLHRKTFWECLCDCGTRAVRNGNDLVDGHSRSCGCGRKTHGLSSRPEYNTYHTMRARCENQKHADYSNYGGRGIKVCDRWKTSFAAFMQDMGPRPTGFTIERRDVNGHYEPNNCFWLEREKQALNTTRTAYLTYDGQTHPIWKWAKMKGLTREALRQRLFVEKWDIHRALNTPMRFRNPI